MIRMQLIGNLGRDCTTNVVNGKSVMNITVAHSEKYKDAQGNMKEKAIWVDCAYWSDKTGIAPYLKKGTQVFVEGVPDIRTYTKNDGAFGASMTLRVLSIQLLGSKPGEGGNEGGYQGSAQGGGYASQSSGNGQGTDISEAVDDLPF
ncbi:MAG: single-stranded DNA-binding protein [Chitinophagaceae bacterium]|nr:single-stranded DNA-binding protein [Chitinophagaceae bacterium]